MHLRGRGKWSPPAAGPRDCVAGRAGVSRHPRDDRVTGPPSRSGHRRALADAAARYRPHAHARSVAPARAGRPRRGVPGLRTWYLALDKARELEQAVLDHREILEAIRDGDADRAEQAMRRHVVEFEEAMRRVLIGA